MPGSTSGQASYTLAAGEAWSLDAVVFTLSAPVGTGRRMPVVTVRSKDGSVIARITAPSWPA